MQDRIVRVINLFVPELIGLDEPACVARPNAALIPRNPSGRPCRIVWNLVPADRGDDPSDRPAFDEACGIAIHGDGAAEEAMPFAAGCRITPTQWVMDDDNHTDGFQIYGYDVRFSFGGRTGSVRLDPTIINTPDPTADPWG